MSNGSESARTGARAGKVAFWLFGGAVALAVGFYLAMFMQLVDSGLLAYQEFESPSVLQGGPLFWARMLLCAACVFAVVLLLDMRRPVARWLVRYRYVLSAVVLVVCCVFQISGSSIGYWPTYIGDDGIDGTLFGAPRSIRSDEWVVTSPFSFSQVVTGDSAISPVIRGGGTDVTLQPALPSWSLPTLFRPYYWGYLLFGVGPGLSFFWVGRLLALALVTFEFARLFANGDDRLAVLASVLVVFSPVVQWWNAPNLPLFGAGLVLCLNAMLRAPSRPKRWLLGLLLAFLFGCYAFDLYPAWQVPFFYVFLAAGVWVCHRYKVESGRSWRQVLGPIVAPVVVAAVCCVAVVAFSVWEARDAVAAISGTVYPGRRSETGGGFVDAVKNYLRFQSAAPAAPMVPPLSIVPNVCEAAVTLALFPLGLVFAIAQMVRRRNLAALFLVVPYVFFLAFACIGFPEFLARVTLMSNVPPIRLSYPIGYLDVMLLVFACAQEGVDGEREGAAGAHAVARPASGAVRVVLSLAGAFVFAAAFVYLTTRTDSIAASKALVLFVFVFFFLGSLAMFLPSFVANSGRHSRSQLLLTWSLLVACAGMCVNPVQRGVGELLDDDVVAMVSQVESADPDGEWVADNSILGQSCLVAGAKAINSVNTYPNLDEWHKIDPDREYEDVYNRYAHIAMSLSDRVAFSLVGQDSIKVEIDDESVLALGIDYWLSGTDLTAYESDLIRFEPLAEADGLTAYKVVEL